MFRAPLYPSSGEQKSCYCICCILVCNKRENVCIGSDVYFVLQFVVNMVGSSCVWTNVVCKLVCRDVGLVTASYVLQVWCIGSGYFDVCVVSV
jgi:hypothetical protein